MQKLRVGDQAAFDDNRAVVVALGFSTFNLVFFNLAFDWVVILIRIAVYQDAVVSLKRDLTTHEEEVDNLCSPRKVTFTGLCKMGRYSRF